MTKSPDVERWFDTTKPPAVSAMRRVREIILSADPRVSEYVKYGTLTFGYEGDLAGFVQVRKKNAALMFGRGARIKGRFPHLEGAGPSARFMRFADLAAANARAAELTRVVKAWCELVEPARPTEKSR